MPEEKELVCVVIIRGESAVDMLCAGTEDLEEYFFPEKMGLKTEDVEVRFIKEDQIKRKNTSIYIKLEESKAKTLRDTKRIAQNT